MRLGESMRRLQYSVFLTLSLLACTKDVVFPDTPISTKEIFSMSRNGTFTDVIAEDCLHRLLSITGRDTSGYALGACNEKISPSEGILLQFFEPPENAQLSELIGKKVIISGTFAESQAVVEGLKFPERFIIDAKLSE